MKRLFKFLVATVTSLSLLIANTSLTSVVVMADTAYTFKNVKVGEEGSEHEEVLFYNGSTPVSENDNEVLDPGTITVTLDKDGGTPIKYLCVKTQDKVLLKTDGTNSVTIESKFKIVHIGMQDDDDDLMCNLEIQYVNDSQDEGGDNPGEGGEGGDTPVSTGYTFTSVITGSGDQAREDLCFINGTDQVFDGSGTVYQKGSINVDVNEEGNIETLRIITIEGENTNEIYNSNDGTGVFNANENFKINRIYNDDGVGTLDISFIVDNSDAGNENGNNDNPQITITVTINSGVNRNIGFNCNGHVEGQIYLTNRAEPYEVTLHEMPDSFSIWMGGDTGAEGLRRLKEVYINDVEQKVTARYDDCTFSLEGVTLGENNTIKIDFIGDDTPGGVIEWTNHGCPENQIQPNIKREREEFKNGSARVVGIYENYEDIGNPEKNIIDNYGVRESGALFDEYNGCLRIENGYWIAFEFTPLPGYQLVEFGGTKPGQVGADDIKTRNQDANVYYFQMPEGNCHFKAVFAAEPDSLEDKSNVVAQGNIDLKNANLEGGSGLVTVEDKDLSTYADRNWENGLEAEACLSIDLDNRFRKANTEDYWNKEIHDLRGDGTATIALDLGEDFEPGDENVQIIHITDEGQTEYLNTTYDPETHTVFFNTTGFSDFLVGTTKNDVPEADVPEGFTAEPQQNIDEPGNQPGNEEEFVPRFDVIVEGEEVVIGSYEGEELFVAFEPGTAIPGNSEIANNLPDNLPPEVQIIYYIDGEKAGVSSMDKRELFSPGHPVAFEEIKVTETTVEIYFTSCWMVKINVDFTDLSMSVLDKNGKEIKPLSTPEGIKYPVFECGDASPDDFTYYEIPFGECPYEIVVKGINGYALLWLGADEENCLTTPIGENSIKFPDKADSIFIDAFGVIPETETVFFTESLTSASAVFVGLSEDEIDDYLLVVSEINIEEADDEDVAAVKKQVADEGYTGVVFPMAFDITLFDKDGAVHDPGFPVRITLVLKEELDLEDGETVVILHIIDEDEFELIEAVYNAKNLTLTFETKSFSPFIVTIGTKVAAAVVSTGETVDYTRYVIASLMIAAAAATGLYLIRKKEETKEEDPAI